MLFVLTVWTHFNLQRKFLRAWPVASSRESERYVLSLLWPWWQRGVKGTLPSGKMSSPSGYHNFSWATLQEHTWSYTRVSSEVNHQARECSSIRHCHQWQVGYSKLTNDCPDYGPYVKGFGPLPLNKSRVNICLTLVLVHLWSQVFALAFEAQSLKAGSSWIMPLQPEWPSYNIQDYCNDQVPVHCFFFTSRCEMMRDTMET